MSVRMALAKLTACAVGGAVIGGGAVHMVDHPQRPALVKQTKLKKKRIVHRDPPRAPRRVVTRRVASTTTTPPPTIVTVTTEAPPVPIPLPPTGPSLASGGGYVPAVIGGWGGGLAEVGAAVGAAVSALAGAAPAAAW